MAVVVHPTSRSKRPKRARCWARRFRSPMRPRMGEPRWTACTAGDFAQIGRSLEDTVAELRRASLVPGLAFFHQAGGDGRRRARLQFVGSGPSLFALCVGRDVAASVCCGDLRPRCARTSPASRRPTSPPSLFAAPRRHDMRFITTRTGGALPVSGRGPGAAVSFRDALVEGLGPDGGLYVPETIADERSRVARLPNRTLPRSYRALRPYTRDELDATTFEALVVEALNFPISARPGRASHLCARAVPRPLPSRTSARG